MEIISIKYNINDVCTNLCISRNLCCVRAFLLILLYLTPPSRLVIIDVGLTAKFAQYSSFITKKMDLLKESCSSFSVNYSFSHHTSVHFLLR